MAAFTWFLFGLFVGIALFIRVAWISRHRKHQDEQQYKLAWEAATEALVAGGQLTDEQVAKLRPKGGADSHLPRGVGFSSDRRDVEIARAEKGLPPADNLEGMFSSDVSDVLQARIEHNTAN